MRRHCCRYLEIVRYMSSVFGEVSNPTTLAGRRSDPRPGPQQRERPAHVRPPTARRLAQPRQRRHRSRRARRHRWRRHRRHPIRHHGRHGGSSPTRPDRHKSRRPRAEGHPRGDQPSRRGLTDIRAPWLLVLVLAGCSPSDDDQPTRSRPPARRPSVARLPPRHHPRSPARTPRSTSSITSSSWTLRSPATPPTTCPASPAVTTTIPRNRSPSSPGRQPRTRPLPTRAGQHRPTRLRRLDGDRTGPSG